MERKRFILNSILIYLICHILTGCDRPDICTDTDSAILSIKIHESETFFTKVSLPDEDIITDIAIMVFDDEGDLYDTAKIGQEDTDDFIRIDKNRTYSLFALANMGDDIYVERIEEMEEMTHYLSSPYDYTDGIPMSISIPYLKVTTDTCITLTLTRAMAKIGLQIDRSHLDSNTEINIRKVSIGNSPKMLKPFDVNKVNNSDECFDEGFCVLDTDLLNRIDSNGLSGTVYLYMPENLQGSFSPDHDPRKSTCSYIELEAEYKSDSLYCTDRPLIYRFYLGDGPGNLDVERNCEYLIIVTPEGDGISEDCWRVEKSGLHTYVQKITLSETNINMSYEGEEIQLNAQIYPTHAFMKDLRWSCSDSDVAIVSEDGIITAVGEGECVITCCSTDGGNAVSSCTVDSEFLPPYFRTDPPEGYLEGDVGDIIHISCEIFPPNTPFDIGTEDLEYDSNEGIYEYEIDDDGRGVSLKLKKPGSGMIYMEAGEPVNQAALFFIVVNLLPDNSLQIGSSE